LNLLRYADVAESSLLVGDNFIGFEVLGAMTMNICQDYMASYPRR
jgi:hypothetical protein